MAVASESVTAAEPGPAAEPVAAEPVTAEPEAVEPEAGGETLETEFAARRPVETLTNYPFPRGEAVGPRRATSALRPLSDEGPTERPVKLFGRVGSPRPLMDVMAGEIPERVAIRAMSGRVATGPRSDAPSEIDVREEHDERDSEEVVHYGRIGARKRRSTPEPARRGDDVVTPRVVTPRVVTPRR